GHARADARDERRAHRSEAHALAQVLRPGLGGYAGGAQQVVLLDHLRPRTEGGAHHGIHTRLAHRGAKRLVTVRGDLGDAPDPLRGFLEYPHYRSPPSVSSPALRGDALRRAGSEIGGGTQRGGTASSRPAGTRK